MGSYSQCWLGSFFVGASKNDTDGMLTTLFRPSDKEIVLDPSASVPSQLSHWLENVSEVDNLPVVFYRVPIRVVRDRLRLFGYTLETARAVFQESLRAAIQSYDEMQDDRSSEYFVSKLRVLRTLSVDTWLEGLAQIHSLGLQPNEYGRFNRPHEESLQGYMLSNEWYGFPSYDLYAALRLALEVVPEADELVYDVTDLVWSGYVESNEDHISSKLQEVSQDYSTSAKTVVLTEGKVDSWVISETMTVLYPHLVDYYSFMNFDDFRAPGGAGNLVNLVRSFAGAGIANRTIAIFDNDTAANAALRSLHLVKLPRNIVILKLPEISLLSDYPTFGPTGMSRMNVNGLATSIELLLGGDVLTHPEFGFHPIQWTGFDASMRNYQGEVTDKAAIQEKYRQKLNSMRQGSHPCDSMDWTGMQTLLDLIFSAFHPLDRDEILLMAREHNSL